MDNLITRCTSITPSERQKKYQDMGFNVFIHYGINTFTGKEWGNGKADPAIFNPTHQDTDQWISTIKNAGASGAVLTCKHHDGFCLWQTQTTDYSIKNSPYKGGKGDVVREVSDSCKKYGIKFGIYLSPWDRNSEYYGTDQYNDFYIEQLTELLTGYGDIFCVWLDGACGSYMDGKQKQVYDFERIYETIRRLQPDACISNCGPDVRWIGNEGGYARESEWNVVPAFQFNTQNIESNSQQDENGGKMQAQDPSKEDLGSREVLAKYEHYIWYPAEVDVSIRPGWFYHKSQDRRLRSLKNLAHIYFTSVGGNSLLLLNVPPNREGLIAPRDVERLNEVGELVKKAFALPIDVKSVDADECKDGFEPACMTRVDDTCYSPKAEQDSYTITLKFGEVKRIDKVLLREQCDYSQRVESFTIYATLSGDMIKVYEGTVIGYKKIALFKGISADGIVLEIDKCRSTPYIEQCIAYEETCRIPRYNRVALFFKNVKKKIIRTADQMWQKIQRHIAK